MRMAAARMPDEIEEPEPLDEAEARIIGGEPPGSGHERADESGPLLEEDFDEDPAVVEKSL